MGKPCNIYRLRGKPYDYQYQFGCGILKMVGRKKNKEYHEKSKHLWKLFYNNSEYHHQEMGLLKV